METLRNTYNRKTRKVKLEKRALTKELNAIPDALSKLFNQIVGDRVLLRHHLDIDVMNIHSKTKVRALGFDKSNNISYLLSRRAIVLGMIALFKRRIEIHSRLEEIKLLLDYNVYSTVIYNYFKLYARELVKGAYLLPLGHGIAFTTQYMTIDNTKSDKKRPNWKASLERQKELLAQGKKLQNLSMGQTGEHWIVWHDNIIDLSGIKFSKFRCSIRNIKFYKFLPTSNGMAMHNDKFVFYKDLTVETIDDILDLPNGVLTKLRLVDFRLPEYRKEHYKYIDYATEDDTTVGD